MPETAKRTARVPILGEDGRISDDYIPAAIGEGVESAEAAATRAETAATDAEGSATAAGQSATQAASSASAASASATQAQQSATTAGGAVTQAQSAQQAAEAAKTGAESARDSAQTAASQAQQSATAAASSAANVADKFIASAQATTLEPGSQATASVADQVLTIGVPKGDKGDTGEKGDPGATPTVVAAEGSDLSVSTDEGTVTIDDSALRARIAELENQAANVVTGTSTGLVAHGEDAYAQKPIETRIKGKTWVNRWPVISGTSNGITVATDGTGLVTVTGTATDDADIVADVSGWATGRSYTTTVSATQAGCNAYFEVQKPSGNTSINATTAGATLNVASDATNCVAGVHVTSGTTVNASFRVMLVDGTEAPDCFTPCASITSAQPENLVTIGKNLLPEDPFGISDAYLDCGVLPPGDYVLSFENGTAWWETSSNGNRIFQALSYTTGVASMLMDNTTIGQRAYGTFTNPYTQRVVFTDFSDGVFVNQSDFMVELGSTATAYEPPTVTQTPLPEVELRSLPNGTCDELVIKADGTCEVERRVGVATAPTAAGSWFWETAGDGIASFALPAKSTGTQTDMTELMRCDKLPVRQVAGEASYAIVGTTQGHAKNPAITSTATAATVAGGSTYIYQLAEPQTIDLGTITLPILPAPTFNQYHDADVPSDTSTEYARDINIVLANLEAVQTALLGGE